MSAPQDSSHEAGLHALASLVAECRGLAAKLAGFEAIPGRAEAPFLHRQLNQALRALSQCIEESGLEPPPADSGLLGRLKRTLRGGTEKPVDTKGTLEGLQGTSWTISIPELIGFLANGRKTGVLWVHSPTETFLLQIREGGLLHATSDRTPEGQRLGEILVARGALAQEELDHKLAEPKEDARMLGHELVREGRISEEALLEALGAQIQGLFTRLLNARNSVFRFQEGLELLVEHHVRLNVNALLLESARRCDEHTYRELQAAVEPSLGGAEPVAEETLERAG